MNRSIKHAIATTVLALGALGAAAGANAGDLHVSVGVSLPTARPVQVQPVHMPVHEVYQAYDSPRGYRRARDGGGSACRAPRWDPDVRYMPGQVVRRQGNLFVAKRVSARVWNVNSPPEWTPQYWSWAECR
jgi:hypothetical protein